MSFLHENPNALPHGNSSRTAVLDGIAASPSQRPAPFSQPIVPQSGGPSDPPALNFQVIRSLRMHSRLAWTAGLSVCFLLLVLGLMQPRTYTATSVIYVEPMVAQAINEQGGAPGFDQFRYGSFLDQQMQTIVRPDVLAAALRALPAGTWRGTGESEQSAVARLSKALKVERVLTSYQITVQLKMSDPEAAAAVVNAVTNAYLQRGREDEFKQADLREQILSEERDRVKQELDTDRKEQAALGASMGLASPADGAANPYDADLTNLRTQLATARQARDVAAAQLSSVSGSANDAHSGLTSAADDAILTDPGLTAKRAAVAARRVQLETLMAGMTPSNPQYRQAQDEIADLDRALAATTAEARAQSERHIQDKLRTELQRTAEVESRLNAQLAAATAKATGAGPKLQRAAELSNDIQRLTTRYTTIDEALNALQIETSGPGMAHVPLPAAVPLSPDPNRRNLFFLAALPLGLAFGVSAAVIARLLDRRVYLGSDLQQAIGFAPIAVLPAREDVSSRVTDEYVLRLAAGVESAYRTAGAQSFVVTAVSAATNTRTLLGELASKLSDLRLRVLTITASDLLATSHETMEHQAATLVASGDAPRTVQAGEGIASAKLERMKGKYDLILIDAAPVLHSAEAEYAARCADATILVAESAVSQSTELAAATALLSRLRVSGVGAVLDHLKLEQADEAFRNAVRVVEQRSVERIADRRPPVPREAIVAAEVPVQASPVATARRDVPAARVADEPIAAAFEAEDPKPGNLLPRLDVPVNAVTKPLLKPETAAVAFAAVKPPTPELDILPRPAVEAAPVVVAQTLPVSAQAAAAETMMPVTKPPRPLSPAADAEKPAPSFAIPQVSDLPVAAMPDEQKASEPAPAATAPTWPEREATGVVPSFPRSFRRWKVEPEISPEEAAQAAAGPAARKRFELLEDLAGAEAVASPLVTASAAGTVGSSARAEAGTAIPRSEQELPRAALRAASAKMQEAANVGIEPVAEAKSESVEQDDASAVGRFVGKKDEVGAVPSYTRSKIRLAFKEQEVNSKTTWFSKLFRGDPPSNFKIIPDDADENEEAVEVPKLQWDQPPTRLPEPVTDGDPELSHLLQRIKTSDESKIVQRPRAISAAAPEQAPPAGPPEPFVERRAASRAIEIDQFRAPVAQPEPVAAVQELPLWEPLVQAPMAEPSVPAPVTFAPLPSEPPPPVAAAPVPLTATRPAADSRLFGRPLRPLTYQQLAGNTEPELAAEELADEAETLPLPPSVQPEVQALEPTHSSGSVQQPLSGATPGEAALDAVEPPAPAAAAPPVPEQMVAAPPANRWEIPAGRQQFAPEPAVPSAPPAVTSVGHTGVPLWPAKEPRVSNLAPAFHEAEVEVEPHSAVTLAAHAAADEGAELTRERTIPQAELVERFAEAPVPSFQTPSARLGAFERTPALPDPMSDPAPSARPYRLETLPGGFERPSALEPAAQVVAAEPAEPSAPASISFPPDPEARAQMFNRRKTDRVGGEAEGLTRRWKLLSQFEPVVTDPLPAHRKGYTRSTDVQVTQRSDEG